VCIHQQRLWYCQKQRNLMCKSIWMM
jgi:hypothetical protein